MPYPVWLPGMRIIADLLSQMQPVVMRKTSDKSISNSNTPVVDSEMAVVLAAGAVYTFAGFLKYSGPGDLQIDFQGPPGILGEYSGFGMGTTVIGATTSGTTTVDTSGSTGYMIRTESNDVEQARTYGGIATNTYTAQICGTVRVGATAGVYQLLWSQGTSNATATTLYTDSQITFIRAD